MDQNTYMDLISQYLTNELSEQDQKDLMLWVEADPANKSFFEEMKKLWEITEEELMPLEVDSEKAWLKIDPQLNEKKENGSRPFFGNRWFRIAAALAIAIGAALWLLSPQTNSSTDWIEVASQENETKTVQLPDGSLVTLNEGTTIRYNKDFDPRNLNLIGEAFFEVEENPQSPFSVIGQNAKTTVLGTSFNVRAYPLEDKVEVTVVSGKVAFEAKEKIEEKEILTAGQAAILKKEALLVERISTKDENAISWKTQSLNFDNTTVSEIILSLERHFNIEVTVENEAILNCHFSGSFDQPKLNETLNIISFAMNGEFEKIDGNYILKGMGCENNEELN